MNTAQNANVELARAAMSGDVPGALKALAQGACPDFDQGGEIWAMPGEKPRPLHMAFRRGDTEMARVIMAAGANLGARCGQGKSMGQWLSMGLGGCAQAWVEAGGDPWADLKESLVFSATRGGKPALWRAIVARWNSDKPSCAGWSEAVRQAAMFQACRWQNLAALRSMGSIGWVPDIKCVRRSAGDMAEASDSKTAVQKSRALAKTLFALKAPLMEDPGGVEGQYFVSIWGASALHEVSKAFGAIAAAEHAKIEARAIATATRRVGQGTKQPRRL